MDSAGHEHLDAQAVHIHGNQSSQEKGVGVQLVHHRLRTKDGESKKKKKKTVIDNLMSLFVSFKFTWLVFLLA